MKSDTYLTLCLEQAAKSPLHYRHGCVIVRGGKVIGLGYNDYRPGFDGGALKHGRIAKGASDGAAIASLKEKLKQKKDKPKEKQSEQPHAFIPFEGRAGGGHQANTPLSMHSEMMAIHSALAASSTLAAQATSCEKQCFKLPGGSKRKARLRQQLLAAYVNTVCQTNKRSGTSQVFQYHGNYNHNHKEDHKEEREDGEESLMQEEQAVLRRFKETSLAFHPRLSGEKHHHQKKKQYQYDRHNRGQQTAQHTLQQPSPPSSGSSSVGIRVYDRTVIDSEAALKQSPSSAQQHSKNQKDYKRSGKMKVQQDQPPQPEPLLLPKGRTGPSSHIAKDRKKQPRLNGADLYVARLGWANGGPVKLSKPSQGVACSPAFPMPVPDASASNCALSCSTSSLSSGSLYDELINPDPPSSRATTPATTNTIDTSAVRASRPCYRCVSYMHSVGIKRVFWTNDAGEWEGGKVRDLVDALDNSMKCCASGDAAKGGPMGNGVFVTKHEVLMLKRMMGQGNTLGS